MKRRNLNFKHLNDAVADTRQLAAGYHQTGRWNLEQNLNHLNKAMRIAIEGLNWQLPAVIRPVMRWMFLSRMVRLGSNAIRIKATAPPALQPDEQLNREGQLNEFERLATLIESPETRLMESHPVFGRLDRHQWQIVQRWHAAHHLSFLVPDASGNQGTL